MGVFTVWSQSLVICYHLHVVEESVQGCLLTSHKVKIFKELGLTC